MILRKYRHTNVSFSEKDKSQKRIEIKTWSENVKRVRDIHCRNNVYLVIKEEKVKCQVWASNREWSVVLHIEITRIFLGDGKNSKENRKTFDIVEILRSNVEVSYVATWPPVVL